MQLGLTDFYNALVKRKQSARREVKPVSMTDSFLEQWAYISYEGEKPAAVMCSRRAGKTTGAIKRVRYMSEKYAGRRTLYIHHTRLNGKQQFMEPLVKELREAGVEFTQHQTELWIKFENGSFAQIVGCDKLAAVYRKLGFHWDEVIIDEIQKFADKILKPLVNETLLPTMIDHGGNFFLLGTPPDVEAGFWFEALKSEAYEQFRWGMIDNPHIKKEKIVSTMAKGGFTIDFVDLTNNDPIVQREVFGLLVFDRNKRVYIYDDTRNAIKFEMDYTDPEWQYALGLDLGFHDNDAIVVFAWRTDDHTHHLYQVYEYKENHQDFDLLAGVFKSVVMRYRPRAIVVDNGGHAAIKFIKTLEHRLGGFVIHYKPTSVHDSVGLMNDDYRSGRLQLIADGKLAEESKKVIWDEKREKFDSVFHSDLTEAARYAHHAAMLAGYYTGRERDKPKTLRQTRHEQAIARRNRQTDPYYSTQEGLQNVRM